MTKAIALLIAGSCVVGCGSAQQQHSALNALADAVNPSWDIAIEACDEAEGVVIARPGTTYEEDRADIDAIRATCDRVFGAFESVRLAHRAARAAVDGGAAGLLAEAMRLLGEAWAAAQRMLPELAGLRPSS